MQSSSPSHDAGSSAESLLAEDAAQSQAAFQNRMIEFSMSATWAISATTRAQGKEVDRLRLHDAVTRNLSRFAELVTEEMSGTRESPGVKLPTWEATIEAIALDAGIDGVERQARPDPARLPCLTWIHGAGWGVIRGVNAQNHWLIELGGQSLQADAANPMPCLRLISQGFDIPDNEKPVFRLFIDQFKGQKKTLIEASVASVLINLIALITSLYSMQVYDRVIPTQGYSTLMVLTLGVMIALFFDIVVKMARSHLVESAVVNMDSNLTRIIFARLLNVRLDQLPSSVGSLSAQIRGYETIRGFLSTTTFYLLVDVPFGLFFILMIAFIGSPIAAVVPLVFLCISTLFGLVMRKKVDAHAAQSTAAANKKTGLLVEAIEGAETIKSGSGDWNVLSKWIDTSDEALHHEMALKKISDRSSYVSGLLQQVSYVLLIGTGAYLAGEGHMTMGSLIACSILSGRVLAPVAQIPGLIVQAAHAKASLSLLEKLFALEGDNHDVERPLVPDTLKGHYELERVRFAYPGSPKALMLQSLSIKAGEKVGVVGPIGAGKSTLLRVLSGLYRASEGRILLDGLDIDQISRRLLGEKVGYFQQDHRLFSGTLRENLLIGIPDPGDEMIKNAAARTGLLSAIANHPKGLDLPIAEGGKGLSGGQRQLVALTRLLISHPTIWLLDEPTASMDSGTEGICLQVLRQEMKPEHTLVLVTHKPNMLALVDRLIVIANHTVMMDGPRDQVLQRLSAPSSAPAGVAA